jgi:hypothetical protein
MHQPMCHPVLCIELRNDLVCRARMPWFFSMGGDGLCVKFNFSMGKILVGDGIDLLVDPIDLPLEDGDSSKCGSPAPIRPRKRRPQKRSSCRLKRGSEGPSANLFR